MRILDKQIANMQRFQAPPQSKSEARLYGVNDGYEPWPKDPKDDFEKQKRIEWLEGEIYRLRNLIASHQQRKADIENRIYHLGNELYNLRTELGNVNYNYNGVANYVEHLENKKVDIKRNLYNSQTPEERQYWRGELDRVNDEISRGHGKMQELTWRRNQIESDLRYKTSERDTLTREKYYYDDQISRETYNLRDREYELRQLRGW